MERTPKLEHFLATEHDGQTMLALAIRKTLDRPIPAERLEVQEPHGRDGRVVVAGRNVFPLGEMHLVLAQLLERQLGRTTTKVRCQPAETAAVLL